nr:30S ribosomal protein S21 [Nitrospina gracilis]
MSTRIRSLFTKEDAIIEAIVHQNQVDRALKVLKRQISKEGLFKELKRRRYYEKPSVKKKRKMKEAQKKKRSAMRRSRSSW